MLQWQDSTLALQKYFVLSLPQTTKGPQKSKDKKGHFHFLGSPFPQLIDACQNVFEDHLLLLQDATESKRRNLCR